MEKLKLLKVLLGLSGTEKDTILQFILDQTEDSICHYCNIPAVPKELETTLLSMAVDICRNQGYGTEEAPNTVKSLSEGDLSVSFGDKANNGIEEIQKSYLPLLNRFRKVGW